MKRLLFVLVSAALSVLFVVALWQDMNREWTGYQTTFFKSLSKQERRSVSGGVRQMIVSDLRRVDRCTTCHMAIDQPQLALAEEPFTAHPGQYLQSHPMDTFGCTTCHGGQGLATEVKAAHGEVAHWEKPLLRGPFVQASCQKCHGDLEAISSHVPQLLRGRALYQELGCAGCHTVHGFGQTVSVDLSEVGDKPLQLLDVTFVEGSHTLSQWIDEHFQEPRKITPGFRKQELPAGEEEIYPSFMPHFGLTEEDARALTVYMLSLTEERLPVNYVIPAPPAPAAPVYASSVEHGKAVFEKYGCAGCHGPGGLGGRKNWNAVLGEEVPSLVYVKAYYEQDRDALKTLIRHGRQPAPRLDMQRPNPPLYMPAWKDRIPEEDLDPLIDYLLSLSAHVSPEPSPAPSEKPAS